VPFLAFLAASATCSREFAMRSDLAASTGSRARGVEIGALAEVFRNRERVACARRSFARTTTQAPGRDGRPRHGPVADCVDVPDPCCAPLPRRVVLSDSLLRTLSLTYARRAEDAVDCYAADAAINSLGSTACGGTADGPVRPGLSIAAEKHLRTRRAPADSSWERVASALPGFLGDLRDAVHEDSLAAAPRDGDPILLDRPRRVEGRQSSCRPPRGRRRRRATGEMWTASCATTVVSARVE